MAWVKVESSVSRNRKFVKAGPAPAWLWLCGLAYCQEGLTDGFIPHEALDYLGVKNAKNLAARLVEARLWDVVSGGWMIHDYLEHNKSAAQIKSTSKARAEGGNLGGRPPKTLEVSDKVNHTENPALTAHTDTAPKQQHAAAPVARAPLHDAGHKKHAHCGRVCLHSSLFGEFVRRRGHIDADQEVRDWCMDVEREWSGTGPRAHEEPGDSFDFWRARYDERWPSATATVGKTAGNAAVLRRFVERHSGGGQ